MDNMQEFAFSVGFFALGALLGNFYIFSGYGLKTPSDLTSNKNEDGGDFQKAPRIRNLQYLLFGAIATLLVNWKPIVGDVSSGIVFASYLMGSIIGASVSLFWVKGMIQKEVRRKILIFQDSVKCQKKS